MKPVIIFEKKVINSNAFKPLSRWSIRVYLNFLCKRKMKKLKTKKGRSNDWIIENNGEIVFTYAEAEKQGIGRREFRNAIDQLVDKGFLDITHQGSGGHKGDTSKYALSERWKDYGTKEFQPTRTPRKKDKSKWRGWNRYHEKKAGNGSVT